MRQLFTYGWLVGWLVGFMGDLKHVFITFTQPFYPK